MSERMEIFGEINPWVNEHNKVDKLCTCKVPTVCKRMKECATDARRHTKLLLITNIDDCEIYYINYVYKDEMEKNSTGI